MGNIFNTFLATAVANDAEQRRRQHEEMLMSQQHTSEALAQNLALRKQQDDEQKQEAQKIGAAGELTHEGGNWTYADPELQHQGEVAALGERADLQKQQIGAQINAQKLADILRGREDVANIGAGGRVKAAEVGAEATKYRADEMSGAMRYAADKRMLGMLQRPRLNSFWQEKKYWDTGEGGKALSNLNTAVQHMDRLRGAIAELKNNGTVHLNQAGNAYEYEMGDPRIVNFKTIAHVETREIAKFLNGSGVLTDAEKASTDSLINENLPMKAQEAVLEDLWHMGTDKHEALMHQRNHMFEDPDQFQSWSPGAIEAAGRSGQTIDTTQGNGPRTPGAALPSPPGPPGAGPSGPSTQQQLLPVGTRVKFPDGTIRPVTKPVPLPDGAQVVQ